MRCLVTGASGHLGSHIARHLARSGHHVVAMVRAQSSLAQLAEIAREIDIVRGDLSNIRLAEQEIVRAGAEVVIHAAWSGMTADHRESHHQMTTNVAGSLQLFDIARNAGMKHWIGIGSQAEYGAHDVALHERLPTLPATAYGVGKLCVGLMTEKMCELSKIRFAWVRLLATYGPGDDAKHFIPGIVNRLLRGERPSMTAGEQKWDYLFVEDAAAAICGLAAESAATGYFNLGSGVAHSVRSIAERIRDFIDPSISLGLGEIPYAKGQMMLLQADISRLCSAIRWKPSTTLEEGLKRTIAWHKSRYDEPVLAKGQA